MTYPVQGCVQGLKEIKWDILKDIYTSNITTNQASVAMLVLTLSPHLVAYTQPRC